MKNKTRLFSVIIITLSMMLMGISSCLAGTGSEANWQFVDAVNDRGYYIEVAGADVTGVDEYVAEMAIVQPKDNLYYVYVTRFNTAQGTYQYLRSYLYYYDCKSLISKHEKPMAPQSYIKNEAIHEVAWFLSVWKRTHIH